MTDLGNNKALEEHWLLWQKERSQVTQAGAHWFFSKLQHLLRPESAEKYQCWYIDLKIKIGC